MRIGKGNDGPHAEKGPSAHRCLRPLSGTIRMRPRHYEYYAFFLGLR